jgi:hypothetical protein
MYTLAHSGQPHHRQRAANIPAASLLDWLYGSPRMAMPSLGLGWMATVAAACCGCERWPAYTTTTQQLADDFFMTSKNPQEKAALT